MSELAQVLRHILPASDPRALVDATTGDDAAVYLMDEGRALVVTVDFFTPVVDDPGDFGRIAAANALSDLYAMGARPLFVLNLVSFPRKHLGEGILEAIVQGGAEKVREAGASILGGHSIDDPEPKFGMVAVGEADPASMVTLAGARPGDRLVLTKPLGTGIVATAVKADAAPVEVQRTAVEVMATLNRVPAEAMVELGVRAATDVTGFGLLGHLRNLLRSSGHAAHIHAASVPLLPGVLELAAAGHVPGGTKRNARDVEEDVEFGDAVGPLHRILLADAQTSGGLLMAVPDERLDALLEHIEGRTPTASVVGQIVEGPPGRIRVD